MSCYARRLLGWRSLFAFFYLWLLRTLRCGLRLSLGLCMRLVGCCVVLELLALMHIARLIGGGRRLLLIHHVLVRVGTHRWQLRILSWYLILGMHWITEHLIWIVAHVRIDLMHLKHCLVVSLHQNLTEFLHINFRWVKFCSNFDHDFSIEISWVYHIVNIQT